MPNSPHSVVGKYQILELVGEGAMGSVYRARDPVLNRIVAVKVMSDAIARDDSLRDRFMREAQAAGSLQHPNVVTIFDFGDYDGHLYIAMEFVEGVDVEQVIAERTPISLADRLGITIDVLLGLSYAHKRGVVHRDIKPANIRLCEDGRAKIMDFGVAHLESAKMTATGVMMGTPNYMAPEQVTGQKIGPPADIFSLGAVLYELLTYKKAFAGDSLHNVLFKVVSEDPPALALVADLPRTAELEKIVRRALAKEPADRFQSAQEMANDLTGIRASLSGTNESGSLSLSATIAAQARQKRDVTKGSQLSTVLAGRRPRWSGTAMIAASVVAAAAILAATQLISSRSTTRAAGGEPEASSPARAPAPPGDSSAVTAQMPPPVAPASGLPAHAAADSPSVTLPVDSSPSRTPPATPAPDRDVAMARALQRSAREARVRAAAVGATPAQLAAGSRAFALGERLMRAKKYPEAVVALDEALASWGAAATLARGRRTAVESPGTVPNGRATADSAILRPPVLRQVPPAANPPVVAPPATVPPAPVTASRTDADPAASRDAVADIQTLVAGYAQAIEGRDLAAVRALYPSITPDQTRGFERFFAAVRSLRASLSAAKPEVSGSTASARIAGTYEYIDASGQAQRQPVAFQATFHREAAGWRIASVR